MSLIPGKYCLIGGPITQVLLKSNNLIWAEADTETIILIVVVMSRR